MSDDSYHFNVDLDFQVSMEVSQSEESMEISQSSAGDKTESELNSSNDIALSEESDNSLDPANPEMESDTDSNHSGGNSFAGAQSDAVDGDTSSESDQSGSSYDWPLSDESDNILSVTDTQSGTDSDTEPLNVDDGDNTLPEIHCDPDAEDGSSESVVICPVCRENIKNRSPNALPCGHMICKACLTRIIGINKKCPVCRKEFIRSNIKQLFPM